MATLLIAEMLKKKKMSKRQLAKLIDVRYEHVFRIFREGYDPKLSTLARIAKALECRIRDLYRD